MRVGVITSNRTQNYSKTNVIKKSFNYKLNNPQNDTVNFKGKGGKFLGGLLGGAAGGAAGGAIIGGGSIAGMAALAALGPVGIGLAAIYTIGGAIAGGYVGSGVGDVIEGEDDEND